MATETHC